MSFPECQRKVKDLSKLKGGNLCRGGDSGGGTVSRHGYGRGTGGKLHCLRHGHARTDRGEKLAGKGIPGAGGIHRADAVGLLRKVTLSAAI